MEYCKLEDIAAAIRMDVLLAWGKDDSRENDALAYGRLEQCMLRAKEEIDLYIGKAVSLPLSSVPSAITDCAVKLSIYKMASRKGIIKDSADQTIRINYEDAIKLLEKIASGKVSLGVDASGSAVETASSGITSHFPKSRMEPW